MPKVNELSFVIKKKNLLQLIEILKDLSRLNDKVLIKIDQENTLIYSLVGGTNSVSAFKNFIFKTEEIFSNIGDFDETINYIIKSAKQMFRTLQIISSFDSDVDGSIFFDTISDAVYADRINLKVGKKLRQNFYGGDPISMNTRINIDQIKSLTRLENALFDFELKDEDFDKIKKLSSPDEVTNIFYLNVFDNGEDKYSVSVGEGPWDIVVAETDYRVASSTAFTKKYFKTINMVNGSARVYLFDAMLLVVTENSNLLISNEVTV